MLINSKTIFLICSLSIFNDVYADNKPISLMQLASQGDADAQFNLGNMYEQGVIKGSLKGILKGKK